MYYSSNQVDSTIEQHLPEFGYACDVGANDGVFFSNTKHYEDKGWLVLCVEPNPLLEESGREKRKLWRNVACGRENGTTEFTACGQHPYASNSGLRSDIDGKKFTVPMVKLDDLIEQAGFPRLDFLSVDCEGWEDEVMAGFTVERWKPKIIVLEYWTGDGMDIQGYEKLCKLEFDVIYLRKA